MRTYRNGDATRAKILASLPATTTQVSDKCCICQMQALKHLKAMSDRGIVMHVGKGKVWLDVRTGDARM